MRPGETVSLKCARKDMKFIYLVLTIPYNTLYFESSEEGTVADLFLKLRKYADTNKDDENSFFMREIKRATDNIVYRLVK